VGALESRLAGATRRSLRAALALACGLGLAYAASWSGAPAARAPGRVCWWVADRDAHQLVGLDRDLHVAQRRELRWPLLLAARADGGVWVARALEGGPHGAHELVRFDALAQPHERYELPAVRALCAADGARAWVLSDAGADSAQLLQVELGRVPLPIARFAGARLLCARSAAELAIGSGAGRLWLVDATGRIRAERCLDGALAALAPGPSADQCWALERAPDARLWLLGARLESLRVQRTGLDGGRLASESGAPRVWVADARRRHARRFGAASGLELDWTDVPLAGLMAGAAERGGGALWLAPGALLRVDARAGLVPGQGGFGHAHDLARVPDG
jgi:hypothetical protein